MMKRNYQKPQCDTITMEAHNPLLDISFSTKEMIRVDMYKDVVFSGSDDDVL